MRPHAPGVDVPLEEDGDIILDDVMDFGARFSHDAEDTDFVLPIARVCENAGSAV